MKHLFKNLSTELERFFSKNSNFNTMLSKAKQINPIPQYPIPKNKQASKETNKSFNTMLSKEKQINRIPQNPIPKNKQASKQTNLSTLCFLKRNK